MARTTSSAVAEILEDNYNGTSNLGPYIAMATMLVDRIVVCATAKAHTHTTAEKEMLERLLAAFFYVLTDPTYKSGMTSKASGAFTGEWGKYLDSNNYGQGALILDTSGCLLAIANGASRRTASAAWLGRAPSEQTDYADRD